jgi:cyclophilin family peptidyl-prolyl cis-trans isomerase
MKKLILLTLLFTLAVGFNACKKGDDPAPDNTGGGNTEPKEEIIELKTSFGTMYMWLYKETPKHRDNFLKLAKQGFFDGTTFHRIVSNFVIQGGDPNSKDNDPNNDGQGGPGYLIDAEILSSLKHEYGAIGAARTNNPAKASSGSQFYVVVNKNGTPNLDGNYTVFGKVFKGMDAADEIVKQPNSGSPNNRPTTDIKMEVKVLEKTLAELKSEFNFEPPQ